MPKLCSFGCSPSGVAMHRFPSFKKFPKSFVAWVNLVGGKLEQTSDYEHYQKKLICDIHFAVQDRTRNNRLSPMAIPSLFLSGLSIGEQEAKPRLSSTNTEQFAGCILKEGQIHNRSSHISCTNSGNSHYTAADVIKEHNYSTASRNRPIRKKLKKGPKLSMIYIFGQMKSYSRKLKHLNCVINRLKKRASFYKIRLEKYRNYLKTQHFIKLSEK